MVGAATATATRTALMHKDHFIGSSGSWLNKFPSTVQGCVDLCPDSKYITYAVYTDKNCRCLGKSSSGFKYNCATYEIKSIAGPRAPGPTPACTLFRPSCCVPIGLASA